MKESQFSNIPGIRYYEYNINKKASSSVLF